MRTRWGTMLLALWIGIGLAPLASGDYPLPIFNIDFNGDTIGAHPSVSGVVSLTETNTMLTSQSGSNEVVSTYVTAGDSLLDQPLRVWRDLESPATMDLRMTFNTVSGLQLSNYITEMDVLVDTWNTAAGLAIYYYGKYGSINQTTNEIGNVYLNLLAPPDNGRLTLTSGNGASVTNRISLDDAWQAQDVFRLGMYLDVTARTLAVRIDGSTVGSVDIPDDVLPGELLTMGIVRIRTISSSFEGDFAIDNITTAIPEPGSLLLVTAGLLLFRMRQRRNPSAT